VAPLASHRVPPPTKGRSATIAIEDFANFSLNGEPDTRISSCPAFFPFINCRNSRLLQCFHMGRNPSQTQHLPLCDRNTTKGVSFPHERSIATFPKINCQHGHNQRLLCRWVCRIESLPVQDCSGSIAFITTIQVMQSPLFPFASQNRMYWPVTASRSNSSRPLGDHSGQVLLDGWTGVDGRREDSLPL
jgi:hypothetical protein